MLKAICFDLDNTIYPQDDFELSAYEIISELVCKYYNVNFNSYYSTLKELYEDNNDRKTFDKAIIKTLGYFPKNWDGFVREKIIPAYRNHKPLIKPFSEIINLINIFRKNQLIVSMITNGNSIIQNNKIEILGIRDLFDKIYISDDFDPPARKPEIEMFIHFLKDFNLKGKECVYFGDNINIDSVCEKVGIIYCYLNNYRKYCINQNNYI